MFGKSLTLFRLFGFDVRLNLTWFFLALLIAWSLAEGVFPELHEGWPRQTYWWTAILGVIGLFFSIIVHELSHSLVARTYGLPMGGITLFLFGGMAHMEQEPPSPKVEFVMAIAGPISSLVLAGIFFLVVPLSIALNWPEQAQALAEYLSVLNLILAVFNLLPAFPLDGGRVLRATMWWLTGDMMRATKMASRVGSLFGLILMAFGFVWLLEGQFITGVWWFLIGVFLRGAAQGSYNQLEMRQALTGETVRDFLTGQASAVSPHLSIDALVERKVYEFYQDLFAVVENDRLVGCISIEEIKSIPRQRWTEATVGEVMKPCDTNKLVAPGDAVFDVLRRFNETHSNWLIVAEGDTFVGMLSGREILRYIGLKMVLGRS